MADTVQPAITELLQRLSRGDKTAEAELLPHVYHDLHRIAMMCLRGERLGLSLQATDLVHEAYVRLIPNQDIDWKSRAHLFALSARCMRRILVDHARRQGAERRGGGVPRVPVDDVVMISPEECSYVCHLHEALEIFASIDPRAAQAVEMRYFGGLTEEEIGEALGVSSRTVKRDLRIARAWLFDRLSR
jgi:RNA polymerase sigma factor (TIGR02999 family)